MIHNGDFLGMNSMYDCGEKYAMPGYQLSQRDTYQNQGISVFSMIFDTNYYKKFYLYHRIYAIYD